MIAGRCAWIMAGAMQPQHSVCALLILMEHQRQVKRAVLVFNQQLQRFFLQTSGLVLQETLSGCILMAALCSSHSCSSYSRHSWPAELLNVKELHTLLLEQQVAQPAVQISSSATHQNQQGPTTL